MNTLMNTYRTSVALALFAAGAAHAQLVEPAPQTLRAISPEAVAFARIPPPLEPAYLLDEGAHPFTKLFDGFRTDPRLAVGINLNRYLALEAGYMERKDRGFHRAGRHSFVDPYYALDETGALGVEGFHSYAAAKVTAPLGDGLSVYGKLGAAHSERRGDDAVGTKNNVVDGLYSGIGAQYKLNERATVSVEGRKFGDSAEQWGKDSNGNRAVAKFGRPADKFDKDSNGNRIDAKMRLGF
ncbi:MAG: outer membrane beta-barrel protein [Telluria sp.]